MGGYTPFSRNARNFRNVYCIHPANRKRQLLHSYPNIINVKLTIFSIFSVKRVCYLKQLQILITVAACKFYVVYGITKMLRRLFSCIVDKSIQQRQGIRDEEQIILLWRRSMYYSITISIPLKFNVVHCTLHLMSVVSLITNKNGSGLRMNPWGTPDFAKYSAETWFL